ncbi:FHA domain-containing protein [Limoniibacter endophyticus]|uniref:Forkhead-associated protein n=1 Tax=Limoniibacter endophyticus TaxID=1565040 RepID=A0A8J3GH48_9HYPH|nr:FHA domain-containing protein [Limoniibacter endophyticus]GHC69532.1 forkhead-associated protein [Limoniibacter endophyticus]
MRLELRQTAGPALAGTARFSMQRGRVTMGRAYDCNWMVEDETRTISKQHCRIERDRDGYILFDMSANGTRVDGELLLEGQSRRLNDGSQVQLGAYAFEAAINGANEHDRDEAREDVAPSGETLTISAILSDVSPGGSTTGILAPGSDDWALPVAQPIRGTPSSRNVDIGWSGPPQTDGSGFLPDDWNRDLDMGNRLEHASAMHVSVPITRSKPKAAEKAATADKAFNAIFEEQPKEVAPRAPADDQTLPSLLLRQETVLARLSSDLGLRFEPAMTGQVSDRMTRIAVVQEEIARRIEEMMALSNKMLEPRVIEARVDARKRLLPWQRNGAYWAEYKEQFERHGQAASVHETLVSAVAAALAGNGGKKTGEEE